MGHWMSFLLVPSAALLLPPQNVVLLCLQDIFLPPLLIFHDLILHSFIQRPSPALLFPMTAECPLWKTRSRRERTQGLGGKELLSQKTSWRLAKTGQWLFKWLVGETGKKIATWGHFVPVAYFPQDVQPLHLIEKLLEMIFNNIS